MEWKQRGSGRGGGGGFCEIEEVQEEDGGGGGGDGRGGGSKSGGVGGNSGDQVDDVYVAVGKGRSSTDALAWALKNVAKPRSFVYLVHVFPEVHHIPTPLGMLPKEQVSKEQLDSYMDQERLKRRNMLQKFLKQCQMSEVNFDTCLIESDEIVKAVVELIPVLHIKVLILGVSKSNLRKLKKGSSKAVQIQKSAPEYCKVKIICDGREVTAHDPSTSSSPAPGSPNNENNTNGQVGDESQGIVTCRCFKVNFL